VSGRSYWQFSRIVFVAGGIGMAACHAHIRYLHQLAESRRAGVYSKVPVMTLVLWMMLLK
jgi:hypothetical protein